MVETRSDTEISAEADQQNIQAMAKFDGKIEKLQKELDKQTGKTAIGTGIAAGIGSLPFVGYGIWLKASTGAMACTGASTVLGPALLVGGAMIAAGTNQIMHSTEMIDTFGQEMENMKINFAKVNEVLDQKDSKQADLGNEITTAFHKCVSCNEDFAKSLREHLQEFDNTRKQYNNQVAEYVKGQDKCKVMNLDQSMTAMFLGALEKSLQSTQKLLLKQIGTMKIVVGQIRNEYNILHKLFQAKIDQLEKMKEKMKAQAEKSSLMGWIMYGIGVVACAAMFIPGVGLVAAAGLAVASITGSVMNVALQADGCRCRKFMQKISKEQGALERQQAVIAQRVQLLDAKMAELQRIYDDLQTKFNQDALSDSKFTVIDEAYTNRCANVVKEIENAVESFSKEMQAVA